MIVAIEVYRGKLWKMGLTKCENGPVLIRQKLFIDIDCYCVYFEQEYFIRSIMTASTAT